MMIMAETPVASQLDWTKAGEAKISGSGGNWFGQTVALSKDGTTLAVGSIYGSSAFIYVKSGSTWTLQQTVANITNCYSLAISDDGNTAAFGSSGDTNSKGAVFVYVRSGSTWMLQSKLVASDAANSDMLGLSVAMSRDGNVVVAGAPGKTQSGSLSGAAYVFIRSGSSWGTSIKILPSDGASNDQYGTAVACNADGSYIAVSKCSSTQVGAVYGYVRSGSVWNQTTKLNSVVSLGSTQIGFGKSIALNKDATRLFVGCPFDNAVGTSRGSVCIFTRSSADFVEEAVVTPVNTANNTEFGMAVACNAAGTRVISGSVYGNNLGTNRPGVAFIFDRGASAWGAPIAKSQGDAASEASWPTQYGASFSISGDGLTTAIGASRDTPSVSNGAVYIYS